jgi:DNA-binding HxlR family transcriptional regulator
MNRPAALDWSVDNCTIQRALQEMGDRWSLIVLREVFQGVRRFDDLTVRTAIPRQVLTARLRRLVEADILKRVPYQEPGQRARSEYRLTAKGLDLYPVFVALRAWGEAYLVDPDGPPMLFVHRDCGEPVELGMRCSDGHEITRSRDVVGALGPGARRREAS